MKEIKLTEAQLEYIKDCVDDGIESAKTIIALSDFRIDREKAKRDLLFFEEFKKALD